VLDTGDKKGARRGNGTHRRSPRRTR
jgi:hypothetical protein